MSSLREVKDRIASVRSTLKITSAMKLVASSKLRKAQRTIEALRPYATALEEILAAVQGAPAVARPGMEGSPREPFSNGSVAVSECPQAPFSQVLWAPEESLSADPIARMLQACMLCGKCTMVCPRGINTRHLILSLCRIYKEKL